MDARIEALSALAAIDGMAEVLGRADHVDVKSACGEVSLSRFVAGLMNYRPRWVRLLYGLRGYLARLLGLDHEGVPPDLAGHRPEDVPMTPGSTLRFLTVAAASEDRHWIAFAEDRHLRGWMCALATPQPSRGCRFDIVTVVAYRNWLGPVYFNLIRPFHHLIVAGMARAGVGR